METKDIVQQKTKELAVSDFKLEDDNIEGDYTYLDYRYFKFFKGDINQIISVGWYVTEKGYVMYAVAFCSKRDFFSRKIARKVILERFLNKDVGAFFVCNDFYNTPIEELIRLHYNFVTSKNPESLGVKQIPRWAKRIY